MAGTGDASGFGVRPDELESAGRRAQEVSERIPAEFHRVVSPSEQAAGSLRGWETAAALRHCTDAWKKALDGISAHVHRTGGNLMRTADNYRSGDAEAHSGLKPSEGHTGLTALSHGHGPAAVGAKPDGSGRTPGALAGPHLSHRRDPGFTAPDPFNTAGPVGGRIGQAKHWTTDEIMAAAGNGADQGFTVPKEQDPPNFHRFDPPSADTHARLEQAIRGNTAKGL